MYRQSEKIVLNSNISSICLGNMANFGPLAAEIVSGVWGTPTNFNGFRVLASLLQRRRLPKANKTLHDLWPSAGLVHYIYIGGATYVRQGDDHIGHGPTFYFTNRSHHRLPSGLRTDSTDFMTGPFLLRILVFSERELTFTFAICCRPSVCLPVCL